MYGLLLAFKNFRFDMGILGSPWVGFQWFQRFMSDPNFWRICLNTIQISVLKICFGFPAPIILALMINAVRHYKYKRVVQTISYLPHFVSWVVVAALLQKILSPNNGMINEFRHFLDPAAESIFYMGQTSFFYPMVVVSDIWKGVGWGTIIYLAAIAGTDPELYEAASIAGAHGF
jgi:putative aldouronate transport system permease protein